MSDRSLRGVLRYSHIAAGLVILLLVYTPWHDNGVLLWIVRIAVFPFLVLGGLWMWQQTRVNRWLGRTPVPPAGTTTAEAGR
jgi:hypothetical protein